MFGQSFQLGRGYRRYPGDEETYRMEMLMRALGGLGNAFKGAGQAWGAIKKAGDEDLKVEVEADYGRFLRGGGDPEEWMQSDYVKHFDGPKLAYAARLNLARKQTNIVNQLKLRDAATNAVTDRFQIIPAFHKYSLDHINLFMLFVLTGRTSLRGASRVFEIISSFFGLRQQSPSWYSARLWLMRIGYYKLFRKKEISDDWIWIIDHTWSDENRP